MREGMGYSMVLFQSRVMMVPSLYRRKLTLKAKLESSFICWFQSLKPGASNTAFNTF